MTEIATAVKRGLSSTPKRLPPWLFYDRRGSELFEEITALPEYYLTRAEREIFALHGRAIMSLASGGVPATVVELGAGTACKTQILLAVSGVTRYVPVDVSDAALAIARERLGVELPHLVVTPWAASHDDAIPRLAALPGRKVVLFIGSSIGNYDGVEAAKLLAGVRRGLSSGDALVLGTDLRKDPKTLLPAYDDRAGVTAEFNKNMLARINRELGGRFVLERFRHVALWNSARSCVEMHLESAGAQTVDIEALGMTVRFDDHERIHTESSTKYDDAMIDGLLGESGFRRERTFLDEQQRFAVHVARV
jgi:L-histidine Nalpha-methyltransferase